MQSKMVMWSGWTSLTDKLGEWPDVWVGVSRGLQALRTRGPSVIKRIDPRNGGLLLSCLHLCSSMFRVISDVLASSMMLYVVVFVFFGKQDLVLCRTRTLSTLRVMSGKMFDFPMYESGRIRMHKTTTCRMQISCSWPSSKKRSVFLHVRQFFHPFVISRTCQNDKR